MKFLQKYRWQVLAGIAIVLLYFILRLPNLTLQPIFADEAIYIRWAQVMRAEPTLRFLPLSDGKTPLFMWTMVPIFKIFSDPLVAGRILSVVSGFMTMVGIFMLALKIFNPRTAFLSAFIYTIVPYTLFFDRLALVDSMLCAFTIWAIYFAIWLVQLPRLDKSMILGFLLGGALLVKTPAIFNLLVLPITGLGYKIKKNQRKTFLKLLLYWAFSIVIAFGIYNLLKLGPNFQMLSSRNSDYIFSLSELSGRPLDPFIPHLRDMKEWFAKLVTFPAWFFIVVGIIATFLRRYKFGIALLLWALVPMLIQTALLKTFTARYQLPSVVILLIFAGVGFDLLLNFGKRYSKLILGALLLLTSVVPLWTDYLLVTKPENADLPRNERRGYLEDWTAGYNFKQIAQFLIDQKKNGPVVVGTEGFFGTLPDGLQIYLDKAEIPIIGSGATISAQIREAAKNNNTYFVANSARVGNNLKDVKLIMKFEKPKPLVPSYKEDAIVVYQVLPE